MKSEDMAVYSAYSFVNFPLTRHDKEQYHKTEIKGEFESRKFIVTLQFFLCYLS